MKYPRLAVYLIREKNTILYPNFEQLSNQSSIPNRRLKSTFFLFKNNSTLHQKFNFIR